MDMKDQVLENFMKEFFPFKEFEEAGFFDKKLKGDYKAQAERVCKYFGFKTVYEYGATEFIGHLTFAGDDPAGLGIGDRQGEPFVTVTPSIYD